MRAPLRCVERGDCGLRAVAQCWRLKADSGERRSAERGCGQLSDSNRSCLRNRQLSVTNGFCAAHRKIAQFVIKQWFAAACGAGASDRNAVVISMLKCSLPAAPGVARQLLSDNCPTPGAGIVNDDDAQQVLRRPFDQRR
jgi:hypothetical protein